MAYDFHEQVSIGEQGQKVVESYLNSLPNVLKVVDVSDIPKFQAAGIDVIWKEKQDSLEKRVRGEVKTDTWISRTGNFFLETTSNVERDTLGWVFGSLADRLLYLSWGDAVLYDLEMGSVLDFVGYHGHDYKTQRSSTKGDAGQTIYHTEGILVPKTYLLNWDRNHKIIDVSEFY